MGQSMVVQFGSVGAAALSGDIDKVTGNLKKLGATLAAVTGAVVAFGTAFEQGMANVQSVARASAGDLKLLENTARSLSRSTVRDATRATSAMYTLASAGLNVKQIMEATTPVIYLSGATLHNLRDSAEMVVGTLKQFGLATDQSWRVANTFAASIQNSLLNMERLGNAMKYVGPIARSVNLRLEETTAALMGLHDAGLLGSISGTGLRQMFLRLAKPTEDISRMLDGVSLSADGLKAVLDKMNSSTLSTADMFKLFNVRAVNAMMVLRRLGSEGLQEYLDKITDTNSAMEMFNIQMNTMKSQFIIFWNKVKDIGLEVFKRIEPLLSSTLSFMNQVVDKLGDWLRAGSSSEAEKWVEFMRDMNVEGDKYVGILEEYNRLATLEQLGHQMANVAKGMNLFNTYGEHSVDTTTSLREGIEDAEREMRNLSSSAKTVTSLPSGVEWYTGLPQEEVNKLREWRKEMDSGAASMGALAQGSGEAAVLQGFLSDHIEEVNRGLGASESVVRAYANAHKMGMDDARKAMDNASVGVDVLKTALVSAGSGVIIPVLTEAAERTEAVFKFETAQKNLEELQTKFQNVAKAASVGDTSTLSKLGGESLQLLSSMISQMVEGKDIVAEFGTNLEGAFEVPGGIERVQALFAQLGFDIPLVAEEGEVAGRAIREGIMKGSMALEGLKTEYTFLLSYLKDEAPEVWNALSESQQEAINLWAGGLKAGADKIKTSNADMIADYAKIISNAWDAQLAIEKMRDEYRLGAMQAQDWGAKGGQGLKTLVTAALDGAKTFEELKTKITELASRDVSLMQLLPSETELKAWYEGTIPTVGEWADMTVAEFEETAEALQWLLDRAKPEDRAELWEMFWVKLGVGGEDAMKLVADGMIAMEGSTADSIRMVKSLVQAVKGFRDIAHSFDWSQIFEPEEFAEHVADMEAALTHVGLTAQQQMDVLKFALEGTDEGARQATIALMTMMLTLAGGPVAVDEFIAALERLDNTISKQTSKAAVTLGSILESVTRSLINMITDVSMSGTEKLYSFLEALGNIAIQAGIAALMLATVFKTAITNPWIAAALIATGMALKAWAGNKLKEIREAEDAKSVSIGSFAQGGIMGGKPGVDNNLAWLSEGEYIMPVEQTQRYLPLLEAMRSDMVPAFAGGGINADSDALDPSDEGGSQRVYNFNFNGTVVGGDRTALRNLAREMKEYIFEENF